MLRQRKYRGLQPLSGRAIAQSDLGMVRARSASIGDAAQLVAQTLRHVLYPWAAEQAGECDADRAGSHGVRV